MPTLDDVGLASVQAGDTDRGVNIPGVSNEGRPTDTGAAAGANPSGGSSSGKGKERVPPAPLPKKRPPPTSHPEAGSSGEGSAFSKKRKLVRSDGSYVADLPLEKPAGGSTKPTTGAASTPKSPGEKGSAARSSPKKPPRGHPDDAPKATPSPKVAAGGGPQAAGSGMKGPPPRKFQGRWSDSKKSGYV